MLTISKVHMVPTKKAQTLKHSFKFNLLFKQLYNKFKMVLYFRRSLRYIQISFIFLTEIFKIRTVTNIQAVMTYINAQQSVMYKN